jgi:hypothetical protein
MKPRPNVMLQALATGLLSVAALATLGRHGAPVLLGALALAELVWAWMAVAYWLRRRDWQARDPTRHARSGQRRRLDRVMARNNLLGIVGPAAVCVAVLALGQAHEPYTPPVRGTTEVIVALCAVMVPLSMLVSSSVDWYLIRAFREGVIGEPACRPSVAGSDASVNYLRYWVMHRLVCEFVLWVSVAVGIGFVSALIENATHDPTSKATFNLLGFIGIAAWSTRELAKLPTAIDFVRYPSVGLGQYVTGRNPTCQRIRGFVHDVALHPGVQLIDDPLGDPAPDITFPEKSVPLRLRESLRDASERAKPKQRCAQACEFWVPACEVGLRALDSAKTAPRTR